MGEDRQNAHIGEVAIVADEGSPLGLHKVAAHTTKAGCPIALAKGLNKAGGVEVATGFAGNEVVFHRFLFFCGGNHGIARAISDGSDSKTLSCSMASWAVTSMRVGVMAT